MADDLDVPPLEDMSELLKKADKYREIKTKAQQKAHQKGQPAHHINGNGHTQETVSKRNDPSKVETNSGNVVVKSSDNAQKPSVKTSTSIQSSSNGSSEFGGFKKGFLFGGPSKPKQKPADSDMQRKSAPGTKETKSSEGRKTLEDLPFIKKQEKEESDRFKFSEVQEAMQNSTSKLLENKDQWVTDDFLTKLENNKKLSQRLQDPMFVRAISEFQTNPQQAMLKYQSNHEVQEFFQEFCGLMGEHFTKLADNQSKASSTAPPAQSAQPAVMTRQSGGADLKVRSSTNPNQPTAQDEEKMREILSDPDIQAVLMDPRIQNLFDTLRQNADEGQKLLRDADSDLKQKIQKLVSVGLLQFQTS